MRTAEKKKPKMQDFVLFVQFCSKEKLDQAGSILSL